MARILLVEDNELNRDMLSRRLIKRGHEVAIAVDGAQGVEMARADAPDLSRTATGPTSHRWRHQADTRRSRCPCA